MSDISLNLAPAHLRHGSNIGQPLTRRDGFLKVTGAAPYAADHHPAGMLHAVIASSKIARGRVTFLDVAAAKAHPGVIDVMTPDHQPDLAQDPDAKDHPFMFRMELLQTKEVRYPHQAIAVVIADTLEAATEGVRLLAPRYETLAARVGLDDAESFMPPVVGAGNPTEANTGDLTAGMAAASVHIDATYETPAQYHNPLEPHAIIAAWDGDKLVIDTPSQGMAMAQGRVAGLFGISPEDIFIRSPFLGGGFGCKGLISGPQVLGVMAARLVGRPVKLVLRREQMFGPVGHRAPTRQTLRLGADADGKLRALHHHTRAATSTFDDFIEPASDASHTLYASDAIRSSHEAVRLDRTALNARPRRGNGFDRAVTRDRRNGRRLPYGPAGIPPQKLCRERTHLRQALLIESIAAMLRARCRTLRLGKTQAGAWIDARRKWLPGWLGRGHRHLPGADVRRQRSRRDQG
jgi:xanthine dehydrogenase YagR molybdenum-binding subunit